MAGLLSLSGTAGAQENSPILDKEQNTEKGEKDKKGKKKKAKKCEGSEVKFDFGKQEFIDPPCVISYQSDLRILVQNINLNKYDVSIETERKTYEYSKESAEGGTKDDETSDEATPEDSTATESAGLVPPTATDEFNSAIEKISGPESDKDYSALVKSLEEKLKLNITESEAKTFINEIKNSDFYLIKGKISKAYKLAKEKLEEIKKNADEEPYLEIQALESKLEEADVIRKNAEKVATLIGNLEPNNFWTSFIIPNITDDEIIVKIKITEKTTKTEKEFAITLKVKGAFKINFSSGAIFNYGRGDEQYFIQSDSTIGRGKTDKITPVYPVILTHFYFRNAKKINWGATAGLGLTEDQKASFYLGLSSFMGNNQRLVLSLGVSIRPLADLKGKYKPGDSLDSSSITEEDLVTDRYQHRGFFGITYNLSSKSK